jgi:cellulose synthase/poly-beta-1,6-N-acetylglucosamine synthase-like glycosyltransferase
VNWIGLAWTVALELAAIALFSGAIAELAVILRGYRRLRHNRRDGILRDDRAILLKSPLAPPVALIAVLPDASPQSVFYVHNLVKLHYGDHEVLLILDGPTEDELAVWIREFRLYSSSRSSAGAIPAQPVRGVYESHDPIRLMVVEKDSGGFADCLNVGLNLAGAPLLAVANPAATISPDALLRTVRPFLEDPERTLAAWSVSPPRQAAGLVERAHALYATTAWLACGAGLDSAGVTLPVPGAFFMLRRSAALATNGFHSSRLEMALHLHALNRTQAQPYRIALVPDEVAVCRPPSSLIDFEEGLLAGQRTILDALWRHRAVLCGYGALGWLAMPLLLWTWALRPLLETTGILLAAAGLALGFVSGPLAGLLLLATLVLGSLESMAVVLLREALLDPPSDSAHLSHLFFTAVPYNLFWRLRWNLLLLVGLVRGRGAGRQAL